VVHGQQWRQHVQHLGDRDIVGHIRPQRVL
jgi:hypothetical protein